MNTTICVLNIGHQESAPGAENKIYKQTEFSFNSRLAVHIASRVKNCRVIITKQITLQALPDDINALNPDFIISLHANGEETGQATGTEVLYHEGSEKGKRIAAILLKHLIMCLGLKDRGIKAISEGRGHHVLGKTKAPAALAEPFFMTNRADLATATERFTQLAAAYAAAIDDIALQVAS